ncbi:MAG: pre-16S rRNA-processing nuclease YqgF [Armatimonadota bacterium]
MNRGDEVVLRVIAIDPGRAKCGLVVASPGHEAGRATLHVRDIVATERLVARLLPLVREWNPERILVGDGTHGARLARAIREAVPATVPVEKVPEAHTSRRARERVVREALPRGIARLVPPGMRVPTKPWDDTVAAILAEDWFARRTAVAEAGDS